MLVNILLFYMLPLIISLLGIKYIDKDCMRSTKEAMLVVALFPVVNIFISLLYMFMFVYNTLSKLVM